MAPEKENVILGGRLTGHGRASPCQVEAVRSAVRNSSGLVVDRLYSSFTIRGVKDDGWADGPYNLSFDGGMGGIRIAHKRGQAWSVDQ